MKPRTQRIVGWLAALSLGPALSAAPPMPPRHVQPYPLHTGIHALSTDAAATANVYQDVVTSPGAIWMRLHFADHNLGRESYITITSSLDGDHQRLDTRSMAPWGNASAFFKGDTVEIELHVAPGDSGVFVELDWIVVGDPVADGGVATICDSGDERALSSDSRVGRLYFGGCTAWLVSNGAVLTAGHCVDFDPDETNNGCGPLLPNGILDLNGVVEFNIPLSTAGGNTNPAAVADQYPINVPSTVWNFDGCGQGLGKDYAVFSVNANTTTGLTAHDAQGFFRMTREVPAIDATVRTTGCGSDSGTRNFVQQTDTGTYEGESTSGANLWHSYRVDTTGGTSGSPIIWEANGLTLGIHTNAGCTSTGGANSGTSFEHSPVETALENFPGANTVYVDRGHPLPVAEAGTIFRPYNTLPEGIAAVLDGGILSVVEGNYPASEGNTFLIGDDGRAMWIRAPVGTVTIGD